MRLRGTVAIVTGAASGIGRAIVNRFAVEGASVVATDRHAERLASVVSAAEAAGGRVVGSVGDISERSHAEALVDIAVRTYDRLDVLCNNAGIMDNFAGVDGVTDDMWRHVLAVNLDGPMFATRRAVQQMLKQGAGAIINTASVASTSGAAAGVAYTVSKHGLLGLTRSTAWLYGPRGVRCNAILCGGVKTNIGESFDPAHIDQAALARMTGFHQLAPAMLEPENVAAVALFLASDDARQINGALIAADAGWQSA